jgi:hypothetical protein
VTLGNDEIAAGEPFYVIANAIDNTDKLMANDHRHRNRFLRPGIPVVNVHVRAADGCFQDADLRIVTADLWNGNLLEPQTGLGSGFDNRLHGGLHNSKLGESGKREKIFASAEAASFCIKGHGIALDLPKDAAGVRFFLTRDQCFWQNGARRKAVIAGHEFPWGPTPRVRVYRRIGEDSRTAKKRKDNERKLNHEKSK